MESESSPPEYLKFNTTPNKITLLRVAFIPIVIALLYFRKPSYDIWAAIVFGIAAGTDYLDGYLARAQKSVSVYGKLMDPLADKFLVVCALVMLQALGRIDPILVMILLCREFMITGLRALASAEGIIIAASTSAKWKTATQMVAIPFLMVKPGVLGIPLFKIGEVLLYLSIGISLFSAFHYVVDFFKALRGKLRLKKRFKKQKKSLSDLPPA